MLKVIGFFLLIWSMRPGFAAELIIDNQTSPSLGKIAIQWVDSAKATRNQASKEAVYWNLKKVIFLTQTGKVKLTLPEKAEYLRMLAWSKGKKDPDFLTNWVDIIPHKIYILKTQHLMPIALMAGMGC